MFSPPKEQTSNLNKSGCSSESTVKPDIQIIKQEESRTEIEPEGSLDSTPTAFITEDKSLPVNAVSEFNTSEEIIYRRDSARSQKQLLPSLSQVDDVHLCVHVLKVNFRED